MRSVIASLFLLTVLWFAPLPATAAQNEAAPAATARSEEARIPYKTSSDSDGVGLVTRVIGGFVVVALLALASVYILKRYFPSFYVHSVGPAKQIRVIEIRRLTARTTLFLVEVDGARLLLAQSGDQVVNLHKTQGTSADSNDTAPPSL
jgi:flagellar biogenesis protein FliO